jgi:hypothetical protein
MQAPQGPWSMSTPHGLSIHPSFLLLLLAGTLRSTMILEQIAWQSFPPYMVPSLRSGSSACVKIIGTNRMAMVVHNGQTHAGETFFLLIPWKV